VHSGALSGVLLASVAFLTIAAFEGIAPLPAAARRLRACAEAAHRLEALCQRAPAVCDPSEPRPLPASGSLVLENVRARYGPEEPWVLDGIDLTIAPGLRIALRGRSGAGKTSLAQLLVRFRDPDAGGVSIGGVDLRDLTQDDVRRAVVLTAQDAHVFNTTVRENIQLARRDADEAEIWQALERAGAGEWVRSLPHGLDTLAGEDGGLLSGGQRQRIALARALLADSRFLILDEPTAHLDPDTAEQVMHDIVAGAGERGLLVITHSTIGLEHFDEILELRNGRIAGVDS
jgi:ATP-binding cassette, subfamily C, bacterial CydC